MTNKNDNVMRQIKFRAWDGQKMVIVSDIVFKDGEAKAFWKENSVYEWSEVVMQFTGLKDKNGEEIYEGDICQRYHLRGVVRYHNERAMFILQDGFSEPLFTEIYGLEIVGNEYENPDLLNKEQEDKRSVANTLPNDMNLDNQNSNQAHDTDK